VLEDVIIGALAFFITAFETSTVEDGGVGRLVGAEKIDGYAVVEVEVLLDGLQVDNARGTNSVRVVGLELIHHLSGALQYAGHAGLAHKHVVRFFGQHELGRTGQGIEARFGQSAQLELAVTVREVSEHIEGKPIGRLLVERAQNAGAVLAARVALQQSIGFFTSISSKVAMEQIHHGPQMATFFDVDL